MHFWRERTVIFRPSCHQPRSATTTQLCRCYSALSSTTHDKEFEFDQLVLPLHPKCCTAITTLTCTLGLQGKHCQTPEFPWTENEAATFKLATNQNGIGYSYIVGTPMPSYPYRTHSGRIRYCNQHSTITTHQW